MKPIDYFSLLQKEAVKIDFDPVEKLISLVIETKDSGHTVYACGNGGSGANASHFVQDLLKCPIRDFTSANGRFKAICLSDNTPVIMAYANDMSYEDIFVQPLMNFCQKGDLLLGLSGSGNSRNVIKAFEYGNSIGATTFSIVGFDGGDLKSNSQHTLHIASNNMQVYEDLAMVVLHSVVSTLKPS